MKKEIIEYLENLKEKFDSNNNYYQAYKMIGTKITEIGIAGSKKELNDLINDQLDDLIKENVKYIIKVSYRISLKNYLIGPLGINCVVNTIDKNKISKKDMKANNLYYTEKELEKYKLKKGDFKLIVKGLINGDIDSNPLIEYTRKDLEDI
jgi:hypothetical protein